MIIITSTFTADVMHAYLSKQLDQFCEQTPLFIYNQILPQLLLPDSAFRQNRDGLNVLLIRLSDMLPLGAATPASQTEQFVTELTDSVNRVIPATSVPLLIVFTPLPSERHCETPFYNQVEQAIQKKIADQTARQIIHSLTALPQDMDSEHQLSDYVASSYLPYSLKFYHELCTKIAQHYATIANLSFSPHQQVASDQPNHCSVDDRRKLDKRLLTSTPLKYTTDAAYESSKNLLQDKILAIFAEVLQRNASLIGINSAFFDLGGNSLSAFSLIHQLNDQFHVNINFSILYDHATIKLLSEQIFERQNTTQLMNNWNSKKIPQSALKKIKAGQSDQIPIIFIHPIGGTGFCYLDLIKLLPDEQPCYLIQDPSVDANQILFDNIVAMGNYYNHLLLKHFQTTPFILAGYAYGGILALEMVGQLEQKHLQHCIHSVLAFDTWITQSHGPAHSKTVPEPENDRTTQQLCAALQHKPWITNYYSQLQAFSRTYVSPKITQKIVLFKAMHSVRDPTTAQDPTNNLSFYSTQSIEIHPVACDHESLLQWPNIRPISRLITKHVSPIAQDEWT